MKTWPVPEADENYLEQIWDKHSQSVRADFGLLRLPLTFSKNEIASVTSELIPDSAWAPKYGTTGWTAAALTGSDPNDIYADEKRPQSEYGPGNKLIRNIPQPPRVYNSPAYEAIASFWDQFQELNIIKPKLLQLRASSNLEAHVDGPDVVNFHFAISTNDLSVCCVNGRLHRIPDDGHVYALNAGVPHYVFNFGSTDRTHLVFSGRPKTFAIKSGVDSGSFRASNRAPNRKAVRQRLSIELLHDGGASFYNFLEKNLRDDDVSRFQFIVPQSSVDDGSFSLLLGLIAGLVFVADCPVFLERENPTVPIQIVQAARGTFEFLKKVSDSPRAVGEFQTRLREFLANTVNI